MRGNAHGLKHWLLEHRCGFTEGFLSARGVFEGLFDLGWGRCKALDVTWELGFQLLLGRQKMELFEDEKASPEDLVGEVTVLQAHCWPSTHNLWNAEPPYCWSELPWGRCLCCLSSCASDLYNPLSLFPFSQWQRRCAQSSVTVDVLGLTSATAAIASVLAAAPAPRTQIASYGKLHLAFLCISFVFSHICLVCQLRLLPQRLMDSPFRRGIYLLLFAWNCLLADGLLVINCWFGVPISFPFINRSLSRPQPAPTIAIL